MNPSQGLASDTLERTTTGLKRVGDIQVGDYLYDAGNRPKLCIGVAPPATGQLKKITYREFQSHKWTSFTCTPHHRLALTTTATSPCIMSSGIRVQWTTRCDRKHTVKEACDLQLDILSDYFYQDLVRGDSHPRPAAVHAYIETVLDQNYHPGHQDKYSKCIDDYLELAHASGPHASGLVREAKEAIHASMDSYLEEQLYTHRAVAEEADSADEVVMEDDFTAEVFDIDVANKLTGDPNAPELEYFFPEKPFAELDLPSSQSTRTYVPSSQPPPPDDELRSSSPLSDSLYMDHAHTDRFASIRKSLDRLHCDCGGVRRVGRQFKTEYQAQLALRFLQSDHHHLIDPLVVHNGEEFCMAVEKYERLCTQDAKLKFLKLYRMPLAFDPSSVSSNQRDLPVDPYFLGLWIGDGNAANADIAGSDREIEIWLRSYVDRLNSSMPSHDLVLTKELVHARGTEVIRGEYASNKVVYHRNKDVFRYRIATKVGFKIRGANPVLEGLRRLGISNDKSRGIPSEYMEADEETRLAVIAGLIDTDGTFQKKSDKYQFTQCNEGHRKIVDDLKELASSCGILVTGVYVDMRVNVFTSKTIPYYTVTLGRGSEKFQRYLNLPRKRMNLEKAYYNVDARRFTVSDALAAEYRAMEVSGGRFQLENRLVVHNS
ncbi:uncharacterized protein V1513DRAFT_485645 [Lipomyces chichibuensis]|uniref:uncharacterized protein n=1 Tax=Lipomyces chichibuensis TaxID=1546026 RepID=UPI003343BAB1